ncbi:MAG: KOW motif-containing protein [Phycisphaerales bacterium]
MTWFWSWQLGAIASVFLYMGSDLHQGWTWLWLFLALPCAFFAGHYAGILVGWFTLGVAFLHRGQENGGPFVVGDTVQVLRGEHAGKVARVYAPFQHDSVRVDLGSEAAKTYADVFYPHQLLREPDPTESDPAPPIA